jgi:hypothetical protein
VILSRSCFLNTLLKERSKKNRNGEKTGKKQLLDVLKEMRGDWNLKDEALDRTLWRTRFVKGYGIVLRQITEGMNEIEYFDVPK